MSNSTERAVLWQAAQCVTLEDLALWLDAPIASLEEWMLGETAMPKRKFRLVIDLLEKLGESPCAVSAAPAFENNVVYLRPRSGSIKMESAA